MFDYFASRIGGITLNLLLVALWTAALGIDLYQAMALHAFFWTALNDSREIERHMKNKQDS